MSVNNINNISNVNNNLPPQIALKNTDQIDKLKSIYEESIEILHTDTHLKMDKLNAGNNLLIFNNLKKRGIKTIKEFLDLENANLLKEAGLSANLVKIIKDKIQAKLTKEINPNNNTDLKNDPSKEEINRNEQNYQTKDNPLVSYNPKSKTHEFIQTNVTLTKNAENKERYIISFIGPDQHSIDVMISELSNFKIKEKSTTFLSEYPAQISNPESSIVLWRFNKDSTNVVITEKTITPKEIVYKSKSYDSDVDSSDDSDEDSIDNFDLGKSKIVTAVEIDESDDDEVNNLANKFITQFDRLLGKLNPKSQKERKIDYIPYVLSDVVCFVANFSVTSISLRNALFEWVSSSMVTSRRNVKPTLIILSCDQNLATNFDTKGARRDFFTLFDPRGTLFEYFEDIQAIRIPNSNDQKFLKQVKVLSELINSGVDRQSEYRKKTLFSMTEKVSYLYLQHFLRKDTEDEIKMDKIKHSILTPSAKITDYIAYQIKSLILHENDLLDSKERYLFASEFAIKQIIRYNLLQMDRSLLKEDFTTADDKIKIYNATIQLILFNLVKLETTLAAFEPCQYSLSKESDDRYSKEFFETQNHTCRLLKADHILHPKIKVPLHIFEKKSDYTKSKDSDTGLFFWIKSQYITRFKNTVNNPYSYLYRTLMGEFKSINENKPINQDYLRHLISEVLICMNEPKKSRRSELGIHEDDVSMIEEILKNDFVSTKNYPSVPCFVCFKTEDKTPLWKISESILKTDPILMDKLPFVCCDECKTMFNADQQTDVQNVQIDTSGKKEI